jgi:hypothetical protein
MSGSIPMFPLFVFMAWPGAAVRFNLWYYTEMFKCSNQWIQLGKLRKQYRPGERACHVVVPKRPVCIAHKVHSVLLAQCGVAVW